MSENPWDALRSAIEQAKNIQQALRSHANTMTDLLLPNLEQISNNRLVQLKKRLRRFNMTTGRWQP